MAYRITKEALSILESTASILCEQSSKRLKTHNTEHYNLLYHRGINKSEAGINKSDCVNPVMPIDFQAVGQNPQLNNHHMYLITSETN